MVPQTAPYNRGLAMSIQKRRKLLVTGLLAVTLAAAVISCFQFRRKTPDPGEFQFMILRGHQLPVQALAFGPDGTTLTSVACYFGSHKSVEVVVWDVAKGQPTSKRRENPGELRGVVLASRGRTLAAAGEDRAVWVWDTARSHEWRRLGEQRSCIRVLAISDDGARLATDDFQCDVTLWDVPRGRLNEGSIRGTEPIFALAFAPDGATVAVGGTDHSVRLYDAVTGKELGIFSGRHACAVLTLAFSPDGRTLVSGDLRGVITLWDVATGTARATTETVADDGFINDVTALAFSPDGRTLAVAVERAVQLRDAATGCLLARLEGHEGKVICLAFSPDGKLLASGSYDKTVRLWDVARWR
jgi:WD40 repeat protein